MRYLGIAREHNGQILMPDSFTGAGQGATYEALDVGGDILLVPNPVDRQRLAKVERLAGQSISEHRKSLEGLAR